MTTKVAALSLLALLPVAGIAVVAQEPHAGMDHSAAIVHGTHAAPRPDGEVHYLTLNVAVSNDGPEPSTVFIPAGQPVQLMLRNRGTTEHHYRVVGLTPDELWWMAPGAAGETTSPMAASAAADDHDHHSRHFVTTKPASPRGITPTGREVHAYVTLANNIDMVLFTASQPGTFDVVCDLHPHKAGRLTVFDPGGEPAAARSYGSNPALRAALTRTLGAVDYAGVSGVEVEATYTPEDQQHIAVLVTERTHTANLPPTSPSPALFVSGSPRALVDARVITDSVHHRATTYRFARDAAFGQGHQVMTLRVASAQEATWHLPLMLPSATAGAEPAGFGQSWALILAVAGGMVAAMWPCLFQLTVYFIPALAGVAMREGGSSVPAGRRQVLRAAFYFILGFTLVYTATGALIGYAAQRFGDTSQFEAWQRYIGMAAGVIVIGLALRVAAKVRAPLICRMPILSGMGRSNAPASRTEMMLAGLAFATGCMTCFGSALVVGMVVYVGLAQSALYGALVLFLFSLGMGIPLVIAAVAMARALPFLFKLERAVPWMGLASAVMMAGFGVLLISGNYMVVSEWTYRLASVSRLFFI